MDKSKLGQVSAFYGNGKGKTTSALGTALRALGSGYKVHLVQFMKNGVRDPELEKPAELISLESFPNFSYKRFGAKSWIIGKPKEEHINAVLSAFNHLSDALRSKEYDIVIADEILYALQLGLLEESVVLDLIKTKPSQVELILTGSHKPFPNIFNLCDLVTEIKKIKHPYDSGVLARKGIEY